MYVYYIYGVGFLFRVTNIVWLCVHANFSLSTSILTTSRIHTHTHNYEYMQIEKVKEKAKKIVSTKSDLDERVQNLVKLIFDLKMMETTMTEVS